jgi:hypothetical protein
VSGWLGLMDNIKLTKWRFYVMMFLLLTLGGLAFDYLRSVPRGSIMPLLLHDATYPAVLLAVLYVIDWVRDRVRRHSNSPH